MLNATFTIANNTYGWIWKEVFSLEFFDGMQWRKLELNEEMPPILNFLSPIEPSSIWEQFNANLLKFLLQGPGLYRIRIVVIPHSVPWDEVHFHDLIADFYLPDLSEMSVYTISLTVSDPVPIPMPPEPHPIHPLQPPMIPILPIQPQ